MLAKVKAACEAAHKEAGVQAGGKFAAIKLDVSDKSAVADLWKEVPQDLRDVDILGASHLISSNVVLIRQLHKVNNAGFVLGVERVGEIKPEDIEAMFATNVLGLISVTQALIGGESGLMLGHHNILTVW